MTLSAGLTVRGGTEADRDRAASSCEARLIEIEAALNQLFDRRLRALDALEQRILASRSALEEKVNERKQFAEDVQQKVDQIQQQSFHSHEAAGDAIQASFSHYTGELSSRIDERRQCNTVESNDAVEAASRSVSESEKVAQAASSVINGLSELSNQLIADLRDQTQFQGSDLGKQLDELHGIIRADYGVLRGELEAMRDDFRAQFQREREEALSVREEILSAIEAAAESLERVTQRREAGFQSISDLSLTVQRDHLSRPSA